MEATKNSTALTAIKHGQTMTIAFLVESSFSSPPNASLIGSTMIGKFPPTMFIRNKNKAMLEKNDFTKSRGAEYVEGGMVKYYHKNSTEIFEMV